MTSKRIEEWIWEEQRKHHRCQCGCGQFIKITRNCKYAGIPKFIIGHHLYNNKKVKCKQCDKEFKIPLSRFNKYKNHFCSNECQGKYESTENNPLYLRIKIACKQCGKTFLKQPRFKKYKNFCSKKCYQKYNVGENSCGYIDGRSFKPYCDKFNNILKEKIRERDNYKCQLCGKTSDQENQKLTVHHIHYDKENCNPDLITLCRSCNGKVNKHRDYWEEYFMRQLAYRGLVKIYNLNEIGIDYK